MRDNYWLEMQDNLAAVVGSCCNTVVGVDNLDSLDRDWGCKDTCSSCYVYQAALESLSSARSTAFPIFCT